MLANPERLNEVARELDNSVRFLLFYMRTIQGDEHRRVALEVDYTASVVTLTAAIGQYETSRGFAVEDNGDRAPIDDWAVAVGIMNELLNP